MKYKIMVDTPIGKVEIVEEDNFIISTSFVEENIVRKDKMDKIEAKETDLIKKAKKQLGEYFKGKRKKFDLPLNPIGTEFMKQVWQALREIPYGETRSYFDIAERIGNPKAVRAVGMTNLRNPIGIFIPCHRVIGKNGKLVGYAGGLDKKEYILQLEEKWK